MKVLRCQDISPMYCPFEIQAVTVEEIIEQAKSHGKAAHGLTDEDILPATIAVWRGRIRVVPKAG